MSGPAAPCLVLPGYQDSGPAHWQSRWEALDATLTRVQQRDWDVPDRDDWVAALDAAVGASGQEVVLVAHSIGCLTVVHWAARARPRVRGALLVAVPDPSGPRFPAPATGFASVPRDRLPFPSIVVVSDDDPYAAPGFGIACAAAWGARLFDVGSKGHINGQSGLGDWPQGRALLATLTT